MILQNTVTMTAVLNVHTVRQSIILKSKKYVTIMNSLWWSLIYVVPLPLYPSKYNAMPPILKFSN